MATPSEALPPRQALRSLLLLMVIAIAVAALLARVDTLTRERIERNEQAWILLRLHTLIAPSMHDNDLLEDRIQVRAPDLLGIAQPIDVYRARLNGAPVAAILRTVAPDGYHGPIEMLVAIAVDGTLIGVQIIRHDETPGLGDAFEHRERDWLTRFAGMSLTAPAQERWSVRKDGGDFDAFTGATITPRAIVKAVRRALEYYRANQSQIFVQAAQASAMSAASANNIVRSPAPAR